MSDPKDHLDFIDNELNQMSREGHFNEFNANKCEGAVRYALSKLREVLTKESEKNLN